MPIFKIKDKIIYYAHVPKAGGSSIADFFNDLGACSAFTFGEQWRQRPRDRWSSTSPQHIDARSLAELFPDNFFDACFTIVRHPEDRIISEYKFRAGRSKIHASLAFNDWLHIVMAASRANPFSFDGHIRPQTDFIPGNCKVFKLEDGLDKLSQWLSEIIDIELPITRFMPHSNKSKEMTVTADDASRVLINSFYSSDFTELDYKPRPIIEAEPSGRYLKVIKGKILEQFSKTTTNILSHRIPY